MFGESHQHGHRVRGIQQAIHSDKTPAHLKPHLRKHLKELTMKKVKGMPITGGKTAMRPKPPVQTTPDTSADAQKQVMQPPAPFANKRGPANVPISERKESYDTDYTGPNKALIGTKVGAKALPLGAPVGQRRPINQSGQVFGRMGTSHPKRHRPNGAGYPSKRNASFYGE
jgi:hypothetical protein